MLENISESIIFIDEENTFINTEEFASAIQGTDNYYVLITRENLYNLPYSVEEIYGLYSSGKYQNTRKIYQQMWELSVLQSWRECPYVGNLFRCVEADRYSSYACNKNRNL